MKLIAENFPNTVLAEGGAWTQSELLRRGYTRATLAKARKDFAIIAWSDRFGGLHYPRWQFDERFQVIPAIAEILSILRSRDELYVMGQFLSRYPSRKSLLELIRSGRGKKAVDLARARREEEKQWDEISPAHVAELKRRIKEVEDPVRYVVASPLFRRTLLVYDVAENHYTHGDISAGSLIKDRKLAEAVASYLSRKRKRGDFQIVPVRAHKKGYRALEDIPARKGEKSWRPHFKIVDDTPEFVPITAADTRESFVDAMVFAGEKRKWIAEALSECSNRKEAVDLLSQRCKLSRPQAEAILEMRLWGYTNKAKTDLVKELRDAVMRQTEK
jgi:hypothetical protein